MYLACSKSVLFPNNVTAVQPGSRVRSNNASNSPAATKERRSQTEYTTANASPHRRCSARQPRFYTDNDNIIILPWKQMNANILNK